MQYCNRCPPVAVKKSKITLATRKYYKSHSSSHIYAPTHSNRTRSSNSNHYTKSCLPAAEMSNKTKVIFVLGRPGTGKHQLCDRLAQQFNLEHISAVELLREEAERPHSPLALRIVDALASGHMVPFPSVLAPLLRRAMACCNKDGVLLSGIPNSMVQLAGWQTHFDANVQLLLVLYLECARVVALDRCLERIRSGERPDDTVDRIDQRIMQFEQCMPHVVEHFRQLGLLQELRTDDVSEEELYIRIKYIFWKLPL